MKTTRLDKPEKSFGKSKANNFKKKNKKLISSSLSNLSPNVVQEMLQQFCITRETPPPPPGAYSSLGDFRSAIEPLIRANATPKEINWGECYGTEEKRTINSAWYVYKAACHADPIFLLGRLQSGEFFDDLENNDNSSNELMRNPLITTSLARNVGLAKDNPYDSPGGILKAKKWSILVNDAFILGAIHSGKNIFFASKRTRENILSDRTGKLSRDMERPLIVMGRELIGIHGSQGYGFTQADDFVNFERSENNGPIDSVRFTKGESLGEVAESSSRKNKDNFGFKEYLECVRHYLGDPDRTKELWTTAASPESFYR